jgi:hypothetical protein
VLVVVLEEEPESWRQSRGHDAFWEVHQFSVDCQSARHVSD